ncbi:TCB3-like protein [Anopheles sinensis]|uniref:TCB3-like protein n=1 Tax=Anopheles sinensis TaxID=74873 RepID=A0A084VT16_ANOSI|nr:TCB3-like protein [Anopheles sinensis]
MGCLSGWHAKTPTSVPQAHTRSSFGRSVAENRGYNRTQSIKPVSDNRYAASLETRLRIRVTISFQRETCHKANAPEEVAIVEK